MSFSIRLRSGAALAATTLAAASPALASVLMDNTANGTAAIGANVSNLTQESREQGLRFTVAAGYTMTITGIKVYVAGGGSGFDVTLWDSSGYLGLNSFTNSGTGWRDFSLTDPVFSNLGAGQYRLSLGFSTSLTWYATDPQVLPTAVTGLTVDGYQSTTNYGASWTTATTFNAIQVQGTLTPAGGPAIPLPGAAALAACGLAGLSRRRRR